MAQVMQVPEHPHVPVHMAEVKVGAYQLKIDRCAESRCGVLQVDVLNAEQQEVSEDEIPWDTIFRAAHALMNFFAVGARWRKAQPEWRKGAPGKDGKR